MTEVGPGQSGSFPATHWSLIGRAAGQGGDDRAAKRAPSGRVALEDHPEPAAPMAPPDEAFDAAWVRQVLAEASRRMHEQCLRDGRGDMWSVFEARVLQPTLEGADPPPN